MDNETIKSHLTRGAWIEIKIVNEYEKYVRRRTSHEVRGLKYPSENPQPGYS